MASSCYTTRHMVINLRTRNVYSKRLSSPDQVAIQRLLVRCSDYSLLIDGKPTPPDAAQDLLATLPAGKTPCHKEVLGIYKRQRLLGIVDLIRDFPHHKTWYIGLLLIDPDYRNRGLGTAIIQSLKRILASRGVHSLRLSVATHNWDALLFWDTLGFRRIPGRPAKDKSTGRLFITLGLQPLLGIR